MKSYYFLGGLLAAGAVLAFASQSVPLSKLRVAGETPVIRPLIGDSINQHGTKYSAADVLSDDVNESALRGQRTLTMNSDSVFTVSRPSQGEMLYVLQTKIAADRFTKGKLKAASGTIYEISLDGNSILKNESGLSDGKSADITLEPEAVKTLTIKMLVSADGEGDADIRLSFTPDAEFEETVISASPVMKNRFLLSTTVEGTRARSTSLSPDGKYMITSFVETPDASAQGSSFSTLTETATGKEISRSLPAGASWLPSGSRLYYTRKGAKGYDIYSVSVPSMQTELILSGVPSNELVWLPDEKGFIYFDKDEGVSESGPLRRYVSQDDRIPGNRARTFLKLYDVNSGMSRRLTYGSRSTYLADISYDSQNILMLVPSETPSKYPFTEMSVLQMNLQTMKTDTLVKSNGFVTDACYSPDAGKIFIVGSPRAFGDLGVNAGEQPIVNDFDGQGFIMDVKSRDVKAMTKNFDPSLFGSVTWNKADGKIYFMAHDAFTRKVYSLDPVSGNIKAMPTIADNVMSFSIGSKESAYMGYTGEGYEYSGRAYLMNMKNGKSTLTADPMKSVLDNVKFGKSEQWKFTASDGTVIDGTFTLPPDFDPAKKYPLLVYYYGGTSPSEYMMSHPYVPQLYASRGYVVYVINPSGTYGYGQEFSARHVNAWGKRTADDIIEGTKEFCRQHPFVNDKKIGCFGASYGGFMTQYLQTQTDIFAAAVSHAGISNVTSYWGEGFWGYSYNAVAAAESYPWTAPELFTKQGSLFNADKIHTPLLLIHGTADTNVPIGESIQIFNALKILGRDVEFISVADEDHVSGGYPWEKRLLWQNTIMAWFDKYLKDQPQWWNEMYPERHL